MSASKSHTEKRAASPAETCSLGQQKRQYLIASRAAVANPGLAAVGPQDVASQLKSLGIAFDVVKTLPGRAAAAPLSTLTFGAAKGPEILVARLDPASGEALRLQSASGFSPLIVEADAPLSYGSASSLRPGPMPAASALRVDRTHLKACPVRFQVLGEGDKPLARVAVSVYGIGLPAEGLTDENGQVELPLYASPPGYAQALMAKPKMDYWDLVIGDVELRPQVTHLIRLRSFRETLPHYGARPCLSWGQELMMQNQLNGSLDGKGVKIALIDSGCDNTHSALQHITLGTDATDGAESLGWTLDQTGHGTHCAGIIAARPARGSSMHGFAPAAEIHVLKVFPGGRFSDLIAALDRCIDAGIDIIHLGPGTEQVSLLLEQKIHEARQHGIACIAAAGNAGGQVLYPAKSPQVLAVAAIGRQGDFPIDSTHALAITPFQTVNGIFSPNFTCHGPQIGVCAPGVAIVSTVPGGGFDAMDGTSPAAAHVCGLAALLLAHHPLFKAGLGKERSAARVEALFDLIRRNCAVLPFGADRAGAGLPTLAAYNWPALARPIATRFPTAPADFLWKPGFPQFETRSPAAAGYQGAAGFFPGGMPTLQ